MWLPGEILSSLGSTVYEVQLADGRNVRKPADQLKYSLSVEPGAGSTGEDDFDAKVPHSDDSEDTTPAEPGNLNDPGETEISQEQLSDNGTVEQNLSPPEPRRSTRVRQPPDRYVH